MAYLSLVEVAQSKERDGGFKSHVIGSGFICDRLCLFKRSILSGFWGELY